MITTLREMLDSAEFQAWQSDKLSTDLSVKLSGRFDRIEQYAEQGADGSTHREVIEDWFDYANFVCSIPTTVILEIEAAERRHEEAGTLDEIIG
jgi:hypothetical protein